MTNTEVRNALIELRLATEANLVIKLAEVATETNTLLERILAAPALHASEAGTDEADPQFVADYERLKVISDAIALPVTYP